MNIINILCAYLKTKTCRDSQIIDALFDIRDPRLAKKTTLYVKSAEEKLMS